MGQLLFHGPVHVLVTEKKKNVSREKGKVMQILMKSTVRHESPKVGKLGKNNLKKKDNWKNKSHLFHSAMGFDRHHKEI